MGTSNVRQRKEAQTEQFEEVYARVAGEHKPRSTRTSRKAREAAVAEDNVLRRKRDFVAPKTKSAMASGKEETDNHSVGTAASVTVKRARRRRRRSGTQNKGSGEGEGEGEEHGDGEDLSMSEMPSFDLE